MLRELLYTHDPGLIRLRRACRGLVSLLLAGVVAGLAAHLEQQPVMGAFLAIIIAMIANMAVNDATPRRQKITTLLLALPAAVAVTLGSLLSAQQYLGEAVFLVVIFGAVCLRWFGPRGMAMGFVSYLAYFFTLFLKQKPAQLPLAYEAILIGLISTYAVRFWLIRERPGTTVRHTVQALRVQAARALQEAVNLLQGRSRTTKESLQVIERRLNETRLLAQSHLDQMVDPPFDTARITELLFEAELATEQLVHAVIHLRGEQATPESSQQYIDLLERLSAAVRTGTNLKGITPATTDSFSQHAFYEAAGQLSGLSDDLQAAVQQTRSKQTTVKEPDSAEKQPFVPILKSAAQTVIAASLALVAGELLSPRRWYWAVITAFITLTGTNSRGAVVYKGWQRVGGTVAGILAGAVVGGLIGGEHLIDLVCIAVAMFCAFFAFREAYSFMIFWFTIALALLYGLLGEFSLDLLGLRLLETVVGAAIGVVVAYVFFPIRTAQPIRQALAGVLDALQQSLHSSSPEAPEPAAEPMALSKNLDGSLQQVRQASRPVLIGKQLTRQQSQIKEWQKLLEVSAYEARQLARQNIDWPAVPDSLRRAAMSLSQTLVHNLQQLQHRLDGNNQSQHYADSGAQLHDFESFLEQSQNQGIRQQYHQLQRFLLAQRRISQLSDHLRETL